MPTSSSAHSRSIASGVIQKIPEGKADKNPKWKPTFASRISRYYQTPLATSSKFLAMKWDNRTYLKHRLATHEAKCDIDQGPPASFVHLSLDLRKLRKEEVRLTEIERDNRVLLQKMSYVYRSHPTVDNVADPKLFIIKTLGKVRLQRNIIRITAENVSILEYLSKLQPTYSVARWMRQWQENKKIMMVNARFPFAWDENDKLIFPKPERPDTRYLQTVLTPLKKRRDRVRVDEGVIAVDVHGNPFPPLNRRLKTSILLEDVRPARIPKKASTSEKTNSEKHGMPPIQEIAEPETNTSEPVESNETETLQNAESQSSTLEQGE